MNYNCGEFYNNDSGENNNFKMIDNKCCDVLTKTNKIDEILSKDLEDLKKISKEDKNFEDHACYELHLGYSEKQMQKQVYGPYNEKRW